MTVSEYKGVNLDLAEIGHVHSIVDYDITKREVTVYNQATGSSAVMSNMTFYSKFLSFAYEIP